MGKKKSSKTKTKSKIVKGQLDKKKKLLEKK